MVSLLESFQRSRRRLTQHSLLPLSMLVQLLPNAIPLAFGHPKGGPLEEWQGTEC